MMRRADRAGLPAAVAGPFLFALVMLVGQGLPAPHDIVTYGRDEWDPMGSGDLRVQKPADVWTWAAHFGDTPVDIRIRDTYVQTTTTVAVAGVRVRVSATPFLDDADDVNARDRRADVEDLAAEQYMGLVA